MKDSFTYEPHNQTLIIHLPKELDHHNCRDLKYETDLLFSENYIRRVVFDFTKTEFMDSSGIGILLNRYKQMHLSGGKMALYGANTQIRRVLMVGGVEQLMRVCNSREAALVG